MADYTEGVSGSGAVILKDGLYLTISEILKELRAGQAWREFSEGCYPPEVKPLVCTSETTGEISIVLIAT